MSGILVLVDMVLTLISILTNLSIIICLRDSKVTHSDSRSSFPHTTS